MAFKISAFSFSCTHLKLEIYNTSLHVMRDEYTISMYVPDVILWWSIGAHMTSMFYQIHKYLCLWFYVRNLRFFVAVKIFDEWEPHCRSENCLYRWLQQRRQQNHLACIYRITCVCLQDTPPFCLHSASLVSYKFEFDISGVLIGFLIIYLI